MWIELLANSGKKYKVGTAAVFSDIQSAEAALAIALPSDLVSCLKECGEVIGPYGESLVWPISRIVAENRFFRSNEDFKDLYMSFDPLLFVGDGGNGDQFAYPIQNGKINKRDIFVWSHETDSRTAIAPSLERFVEWWLAGRIDI